MISIITYEDLLPEGDCSWLNVKYARWITELHNELDVQNKFDDWKATLKSGKFENGGDACKSYHTFLVRQKFHWRLCVYGETGCKGGGYV